MGLREAFTRIGKEYALNSKVALKGNPLAAFIRNGACNEVTAAISGQELDALKVTGSPGQGNWARVPWIAIFNRSITETATAGFYVVYLFSSDMRRLYLSLNQGITSVYYEFGKGSRQELSRRAGLGRDRLGMHGSRAQIERIDLGDNGLGAYYESGNIISFEYDVAKLPTEKQLRTDLNDLLKAYAALFAKGGLTGLSDDGAYSDSTDATLEERRRYKQHRSIERNSKTAAAVKKRKGFVCQGCEIDFGRVYGEFGKGYIEAHHLVPLASLPVDSAVTYDVDKDFAVLCANCHRMMHRKGGPLGISELRLLPGVVRLRDALNRDRKKRG